MAFNWVDYVLIAVFFISILGGLVRGGVREIMALLTWIAAFVIASVFAKPLASAFTGGGGTQSIISSASSADVSSHVSMLALGVSFCVLFFGTILIGSFLGYFANRAVEATGVSLFNRLLGGIFGIARGYLVNLLIVFIVQLTPFAERTVWAESSIVRTLQPTVQWLGNKVQPGFESLKSRVGQTLEGISTTGTEEMGGSQKQ